MDRGFVLAGYCQVDDQNRRRYCLLMNIPSSLPRLKGYRHPREVISYAVWAYHRFALSTADVEDPLAERGVVVYTHLETTIYP